MNGFVVSPYISSLKHCKFSAFFNHLVASVLSFWPPISSVLADKDKETNSVGEKDDNRRIELFLRMIDGDMMDVSAVDRLTLLDCGSSA